MPSGAASTTVQENNEARSLIRRDDDSGLGGCRVERRLGARGITTALNHLFLRAQQSYSCARSTRAGRADNGRKAKARPATRVARTPPAITPSADPGAKR